MFLRHVIMVLMCVAVVGCGEEPRPVAPEDRMQRIVLTDADREAISAPQYATFRMVVIQVRQLEEQRPELLDADSASVEAYAEYLAQLEAANTIAAKMIAADGLSRDQRRLMQRVLRTASINDLSVDED